MVAWPALVAMLGGQGGAPPGPVLGPARPAGPATKAGQATMYVWAPYYVLVHTIQVSRYPSIQVSMEPSSLFRPID